MSFVHLHRHSEWSLGDGTGTSEQYAEQAVALEQPALAITDHGSLAGTLYHMQACEKAGIKSILGMEAYFRPSVIKDKEDKNQYGYFHLVLLAQNHEGWKNLMKISSQSHNDSHFYQKPSVDWRLLWEHNAGLIATSSCLAGFIPQAIIEDREEDARKHLKAMLDIFGDRFYFEIQPHDIVEDEIRIQALVNEYCVAMAKEQGIPFVATADVHSPYEDWVETQNIRTMIGYNQSMRDKKKESGDKEYGGIPTSYLMSEGELYSAFYNNHPALSQYEIESAIKCSVEIADRCEQIVVSKEPKLPKVTKTHMEAERVLREWCKEGLVRIGKNKEQVYLDRVEEELGVMRKLKVMDYFIIVGDVIRWAKDQGIRIGPGRGSAGGSLVCYLTRITAMDPIGYDLLFERFLNEYRTEIPDIDFDIDPSRKPEVLEYMTNKFGADKVVQVAAFQSFGLRAAVKDVARTLNVSFPETNKVTDLIPKLAFGETLETLEQQIPELEAYFKKYPVVRKHATRLQGQIKGSSKHAAAVIVTDEPAEELIPMMRAKDGTMVTQWSERANAQLLSPYGFLKIDMLVTDSLTAQAKAIALIEERHGVKLDFENPLTFPAVENPAFSDQKVVESFAHGRNLGIFQFASKGISGLLKAIKPTTLDHVIAANALYRPGAMKNAKSYSNRKNGHEEWKVPHEAIEQILNKTFGWLVYQEQVMQVYRALGKDVQPAESALFIKVAAKGIARDLKGKERLQAYYDKFEAGCKEKKIPKRNYDEIWSQILQMTTYSFNRSHAAGYALQAYIDAWIKFRYPLEFYAPLLSTEEDKIPQIIRESKAYGVKILPPDINQSDAEFTIVGNAIRFGLLAVKGISWAGLTEIKDKRRFSSWEDFYERITARKCNASAKRALHNCGAFDTLGQRHDWPDVAKKAMEKSLLGVSLTDVDDITKYKKMLAEYVTPVEKYEELSGSEEMIQVGGEIVSVTDHKTKKGDEYARVDIDWEGEETQVIFWKDTYSEFRHMLAEGAAVLVAGYYDVEYKNTSARHCVTAEQLAIEAKKEKK